MKNTSILAVLVACSWVAFNFLTVYLVKHEASTNPDSLLSDSVSLDQISSLVSKMESQMMVVSLIIPLLLIAIVLFVRWKNKIAVPFYHILGITIAGFWMVFGYFIAGGIMYGNYAVSALSIPMNIIQFCIGFLLAEIIWSGIKKFAS